MTALSRALMGRHYLGDVVAGLLVGFVTTAIVTKVSEGLVRTSNPSVETTWTCWLV